ncbi:hypothetical protein GRI42_08745 [Erythrobacter gaetbuli]|uniref:Uncharacterized protein n=1 Tax=Qipengyuania gaetbuli TaxID=266952 RepID=A0A844Y1U3_9SPHN|nr:hypothetical protein [Qipengyuania gaetbuli]
MAIPIDSSFVECRGIRRDDARTLGSMTPVDSISSRHVSALCRDAAMPRMAASSRLSGRAVSSARRPP